MSSSSYLDLEEFVTEFTCGLDLDAIQKIATRARFGNLGADHHKIESTPHADISCSVCTTPKYGSYNVVYELSFSDGASWVIRIPFRKWSPLEMRCMELDLLAIEYIASRTSVPIPRVHAFHTGVDNPLRYPYVIMDKVSGTRLGDVWQDPSWWTGDRRKEHCLQSLAGHMAELATLEFDKIGRLDRAGPDGSFFVGPFPSQSALFIGDEGSQIEFGPFQTTHEFQTALLNCRRRKQDSAVLALLQMFVGALPEACYDAPPFAFDHPDFDIQNIFVDDHTGRVVGLIDWDGVATMPLQLGALAYPNFLTIDWDPAMYDGHKNLPHYDTEDDLRRYRAIYTAAMSAASGGKYASATRNSHVVGVLQMALNNYIVTHTILFHLGIYVFGSEVLTLSILEAIEHAGWFTKGPDEVAEVKCRERWR
ncbi:kinase-like protein [Trametes meyenii]|nr:kinase-like protein [Trametes meyenii]